MISKVDVVIFHSPCFDGAAGCWVVEDWCRWKNLAAPQRFGCKPGQEKYDFPDMKGKSVVIVDICFDRETMIRMNEECAELVVLDHHKTSQDKMAGLDFCTFDMSRSGCQMAYDYFYPMEIRRGCGCGIPMERPDWLDHIGNRDIWNFEDEDTKPFNAAFFHKYGNLSEEETLKAINTVAKEEECDELVEIGQTILEFQNKQIDTACKHVIRCKMKMPDNGEEFTVGCSDSRLHRSEIGSKIARREDCDFGVIWSYNLPTDEWWISLRSESAEKADVGKVAARFERGGGHSCAAGFTWKGDIKDLLTPIPKEKSV